MRPSAINYQSTSITMRTSGSIQQLLHHVKCKGMGSQPTGATTWLLSLAALLPRTLLLLLSASITTSALDGFSACERMPRTPCMALSRIASVTRMACHGCVTRWHNGRCCRTFDFLCPTFYTSCLTWGIRLMMPTIIRDPLLTLFAKASGRRHDQGLAIHKVPLSEVCTLGKSTTYARRSCYLFFHYFLITYGLWKERCSPLPPATQDSRGESRT